MGMGEKRVVRFKICGGF